MISLNITSVTDEIFALTALREAVTGQDPASRPPLLTIDRLPALRVLVRGAFATLAVSLRDYVTAADIDPENPGAERPYDDKQPLRMGLSFRSSMEASLEAGRLLTLKRYFEHLIALDVLACVYRPFDADVAASFTTEADELLDTVRSLLRPPLRPLVRAAAW